MVVETQSDVRDESSLASSYMQNLIEEIIAPYVHRIDILEQKTERQSVLIDRLNRKVDDQQQ